MRDRASISDFIAETIKQFELKHQLEVGSVLTLNLITEEYTLQE